MSDSLISPLFRPSHSVCVVSCPYVNLSLSLTAACHLALLYYDYALTFDLERRLFWSQRSFRQWGPVLFFLNRYCGVVGHAPLIVQKISRPPSPLYLLCNPVHPYRKILAFIIQTIIGSMLFARQNSGRHSSLLNSYLHHKDLRFV